MYCKQGSLHVSGAQDVSKLVFLYQVCWVGFVSRADLSLFEPALSEAPFWGLRLCCGR